MNHKKYAVYALHKSGSMFLYEYFKFVSSLTKHDFYSKNLAEPNADKFVEAKSGILSPHRSFPKELTKDTFSIFLVRDPLDILVSQFYSFGYMHKLESEEQQKKADEIKEMGIDAFCLAEADDLLRRYYNITEIAAKAKKRQYLIIGYHDMVLNYQIWSDKILKHFDLTDAQKDLVYEEFYRQFEEIEELVPEDIIKGKKKRHKRKMYPGDHLDKLKPETIKELNKIYSNIIQMVNQVKEKNSGRINVLLTKARNMRKRKSGSALKQWDGNHWKIIRSDKIKKLTFAKNGEVYAIMSRDKIPGKLYNLKENNWQAYPSIDIIDFTVTDDGTVYALRNTKKVNGCLIKWVDEKWVRLPGKEFADLYSHKNNLYVKNKNNQIFKLENNRWKSLKGKNIKNFTIDKDGQLLGLKENAKGNQFICIYKDEKWLPIPGSKGMDEFVSVSDHLIYAMGAGGKRKGTIHKWDGSKWHRLPGKNIQQMVVGNDDSLWILRDTDKIKGKVFVWEKGKWLPLPGKDRERLFVNDVSSVWSY